MHITHRMPSLTNAKTQNISLLDIHSKINMSNIKFLLSQPCNLKILYGNDDKCKQSVDNFNLK